MHERPPKSAAVEPEAVRALEAAPVVRRHDAGTAPALSVAALIERSASPTVSFPAAGDTRIRRSQTSPGMQSADVIRRDLDPGLREALIRQRGQARGIDQRNATRDVDRSADHTPKDTAARDAKTAEQQQLAEQREVAKREREGRFNDPVNVAKREEREREAAERKAAEMQRAQEAGAARDEWNAKATAQMVERDKIIQRREKLVLEGLDEALMLNFPELHDAVAKIMPLANALAIDEAQAAVGKAETLFASVSDLVERIEALRQRFRDVEKAGISNKKARTAQTVKEGLAARTVKPWQEFSQGLPTIEVSVQALEATQQRREEQAGAANEVQLAKQAEQEFTADPKKETLEKQLDASLIGRGEVTRTYRSSYDTLPGEFSVEVTVKRLKSIVIHAHCNPDGTPKGGNGTHWKYFTERKLPGKSHAMSTKLITALVDKTQAKKHRDSNPALKDT